MPERGILEGVIVRRLLYAGRKRHDGLLYGQHYLKSGRFDCLLLRHVAECGGRRQGAEAFLRRKRGCRDIENGAHQRLDGSRPREYKSQVRNRTSATNLGLFRRAAFSLGRMWIVRQGDPRKATLAGFPAAKARQEASGRFDKQAFIPNPHYLRWMKRFGILPENIDTSKDTFNVYETDKAHWRSLWYHPPT